MTYETFQFLSNEALRTLADFGADLSSMTYNQKRRIGAARSELASRDVAETLAS
jgi:hypothetical protein